MQDLAFAAAVRQAPRKVLRCWLRPYSIGHELLLLAEANPLLGDLAFFQQTPIEQRCHAVVRAVQICCRTWAENQKPDRWLRLWQWLIRNDDPDMAALEWRAYRDEGSTMPAIKPEKNDGRELGSPFLARLIAFAGPIYGAAVYDAPLGMVQWLYFAEMEFQGCVKVKNRFDLQVEAEIREHEENYRKEQEAKLAGA